MAAQNYSVVQTEVVQFKGGLDLISPAMSISPGACIDAVNFEPDKNGGYRRLPGYERFDGRPSPTAAMYWSVPCDISAPPAYGDTLTGATSLKSATVLQANPAELIVTKLSGNFTPGEALQVAGATVAVCSSLPTPSSAPALAQHGLYKQLAAAVARAEIPQVPGTGPVRGVWHFAGGIYAFRDTGANCLMYKSTPAGWALQTFGMEVQFVGIAGATGAAIVEGDQVTGVTSGGWGVVRRVLLRTGLWNSAPVGTLVIDNITPPFLAGETLTVRGDVRCKTAAASSRISLLPGGKFEFANNNFGGSAATQSMFFCDGVNFAHEWDGTRLIPIRTGAQVDAPAHIAAWQNMLVLAIGASVQLSGTGAPYSWTALTGAAEIALGAVCTGLLPQQGSATAGALAVFCATSTRVLYGTSTLDANLVLHSSDAGAAPYTAQNIGEAFYLDTKGVVSLTATQTYGNFASSTVTRQVQPLVDTKRGMAVASCVIRSSGQYRVFFNDGTGLIVRPTSATAADVMYFDYGIGKYMNSVCSFVGTDGVERVIAAGSDGFVYELNVGTSFDGDVIQAWLFLAFNSNKYPRTRKRYRRTVVQAACTTTADLRVGYELDYGSDGTTPGIRADRAILQGADWETPGILSEKSMAGYGGYWDLLTWDSFVWDAPYVAEYPVDTPGNGTSIGLMFHSDSAVNDTFVISSCILHYSIGRQSR